MSCQTFLFSFKIKSQHYEVRIIKLSNRQRQLCTRQTNETQGSPYDTDFYGTSAVFGFLNLFNIETQGSLFDTFYSTSAISGFLNFVCIKYLLKHMTLLTAKLPSTIFFPFSLFQNYTVCSCQLSSL